ncbi:VOC family protein [Bacillus aerius]|uniref:VOC family protein n=1 Tax=Bacillus aerius TaxID=293388 RepID=UPI002816771A|nr:VOC family protein [Bacillus aerius]WMT30676.1 VOC family protein [Bacillus aerius]
MTIQQIATIDIPVTDIPRAVSWYEQILEMIVLHQSEEAAMLTFTHGEEPSFYLVKIKHEKRIYFMNSFTGVRHSMIGLFVKDLKNFHQNLSEHEVTIPDIQILADPDLVSLASKMLMAMSLASPILSPIKQKKKPACDRFLFCYFFIIALRAAFSNKNGNN